MPERGGSANEFISLLCSFSIQDATVITPMAISASASAKKDVIVTVVGDRTSDNVVVYVLNDDTNTRKAKITIQGMTEVHLHKVFGFGGDNDIRRWVRACGCFGAGVWLRVFGSGCAVI
jgi:hypothetical protein